MFLELPQPVVAKGEKQAVLPAFCCIARPSTWFGQKQNRPRIGLAGLDDVDGFASVGSPHIEAGVGLNDFFVGDYQGGV